MHEVCWQCIEKFGYRLLTETWTEFELCISNSHSPVDAVEDSIYFYNQAIITPCLFSEKTLHCSEHVWS